MSTEMKQQERSVDRERLQRLGFSQDVISTVERMDEQGFFEMKPSDDLVERTIQKCIPLLPQPESAAELLTDLPSWRALRENYFTLLRDLSTSVRASSEWSEFSHVQGWQHACLTTLQFAQSTHERPFIMLDNHNVIEPAWWGSDTGFRSFWNASQVVNRIAAESGLPRAACFVVLRPELNDYSNIDLEAINEMIRTGNSDVWWIPYDRAGAYQGRDLIVLGGERVFELKGKPKSPVAAMDLFQERIEKRGVPGLRTQIKILEGLGRSIRVEGELSAEAAASVGTHSGIRHLMESVISGLSEVVR